ncbi:MAG: hypothetical protein H6704_06945 [Myxococcales bacterium]|nr:hypothetical protein [Myxococcales bacterium]
MKLERCWFIVFALWACEPPADAPPSDGGAAPPPATDTRPDPKADDPDPPAPPHTSTAAPCDQPGTWSCDGDHALYCQDGYAGGRYIDRGACEAGTQCAIGRGCVALPRCGADGSIACVGQDVFTCEAGGPWTFTQRCPAQLTCVHGRGCPAAQDVGRLCDLDAGPKCTDGLLQRCVAQGIDFVWSVPEMCPEGSSCLDGQGCVRPGGCRQRGAAVCEGLSARYCVEQDDGVLGWSDLTGCVSGCLEGHGCSGRLCRRPGRLGGCLD